MNLKTHTVYKVIKVPPPNNWLKVNTPMKKNQLFNLRVKRQIVGFYKMYFLLRLLGNP
jgi:hypothetical protein